MIKYYSHALNNMKKFWDNAGEEDLNKETITIDGNLVRRANYGKY